VLNEINPPNVSEGDKDEAIKTRGWMKTFK